MRGECDDRQTVTLALARCGEGDSRQVGSTHREGDVRQVTGARGECEDAGKCKDGQISGTGGGQGGGVPATALCSSAATTAAAVRLQGGDVRAMMGMPHGM